MRKQFRSEDLIRFTKPRPCPECPKYKQCRKPCDAVERWISQDHTGRPAREILQQVELDPNYNLFVDQASELNKEFIVKPDPVLAAKAWEKVLSLKLSKNSFEFAKLFYKDGKRLFEIAAILKISSQACIYRHKILKKEVKNKLQRIEIWDKIKGDYEGRYLTFTEMVVCLYFKEMLSRVEIFEMSGCSYSWIHEIVKRVVVKVLTNKEV